MKLTIYFIGLITALNLQAMDSPQRKEEKKEKERIDQLTDSKKKSGKNLSLRNSPNRTMSPGSSVQGRSHSVSPQGSFVEFRRPSVDHIEQTLISFAQPGDAEEELTIKLTLIERFKDTNRFEYNKKLCEILEVKLNQASAAKHKAALWLLASAKAQVKIACDNMEEYKRNNNTELKIALLDILKARELAYYAVGKKLCAIHPRKFDAWCRYETETDEELMSLNEIIRQFFAKQKITESLKLKDAPLP